MGARLIVDWWYQTELAPHVATPITTVDEAVATRFPRTGRLLGRRGATRALALVAATRPGDTVVIPDAAPGAKWQIVLGALLGRRNLVLLEYINHPPTRAVRRSLLRHARFVVLRRVLLPRTIVVAQVFSRREAQQYAATHRISASRFHHVGWPRRFDRAAPLPDRPAPGRRVLCSGRRVDWPTFAAAAAGADWDVTAVCIADDEAEVRDLLQAVRPHVMVDIDLEEHFAQVGAASVFVVAIPETQASIGQVRVMNAADAGTPLVISRVQGVEEYVDDASAVLVEPGDPAALRAAVDSLLDDPERQESLRRALARRGLDHDMSAYLEQVGHLVDRAADDVRARSEGHRAGAGRPRARRHR